ncbi:helix-turn-helix domain-containing protein [Chloroflexota bacterium]
MYAKNSYTLDKRGNVCYYCFVKVIDLLRKVMDMLDNYFNVIEASRRLKIHPETVKRLCRQGDLPAAKIHNTWLISKDILDNFAAVYSPKRGAKRRLI